MLTARDAIESRIAGLDSGADDYLIKPFDFGELLARLRAVIRRGRLPVTPAVLTVSDLRLDLRARQACRHDQPIKLTSVSSRSSSSWPSTPERSSAAPRSPSTSGTRRSNRCRTSST